MATPNSKGGWDLSDDDLAEMRAMGMIDNTPNVGDVRNKAEESFEVWNGEAWLLVQSPRLRAYNEGYGDAIANAVAAVEALADPWPTSTPGTLPRDWVIAAIKGSTDDVITVRTDPSVYRVRGDSDE